MVAKITLGKSVRGILNYNENKVVKGEAQILVASGFATDIDKLDLNQKIDRLRKLYQQRPDVKTNAAHITLNFDNSDKLDQGKLQQIAQTYMEQIGFGEQPYIVYQHNDAHHPHLHIATTLIQKNTVRIFTHRIGQRVSEPARKQIEKQFGLTKAEGRKQNEVLAIRPAVYGQKPTKQMIHSILLPVIENYCFSSLAELNAVLGEFNIRADRGAEETMMFQKKGLLFSILDESRIPIGVPIKASSFHSQPTLVKLEKKFVTGAEERKPMKENLRKRINGVLLKFEILTKLTLKTELRKENIVVVYRQNEKGMIYGVTYVDHQQKAVFNGSDLGKDYSAKAITERLSHVDQPRSFLKVRPETSFLKKPISKDFSKDSPISNPLAILLEKPEYSEPIEIGKKKKKNKGRSNEQNL